MPLILREARRALRFDRSGRHTDETAKLAATGAVVGAVCAPLIEANPLIEAGLGAANLGFAHRGALDAAQAEWDRLHGFEEVQS